MGDFLANLWGSVFTPGTTPTLLIATNVTFASLQLLLGGLLVATYSIHFAILSFLCGGLWYSINWFARGLQQANIAEAEADRLRKRNKAESEWRATGEVGDSADDEGEDTEVEGLRESMDNISPEKVPAWAEKQVAQAKAKKGLQTETSGAQAGAEASDARLRRGDPGNVSSSDLSTDSEWEKVDNGQ